jgi:hypothetical protein
MLTNSKRYQGKIWFELKFIVIYYKYTKKKRKGDMKNMINIIKELFNSKNLERVGLNMLFSNPNLTAADYARINQSIKMLDNEANQINQAGMKTKKVSYAM